MHSLLSALVLLAVLTPLHTHALPSPLGSLRHLAARRTGLHRRGASVQSGKLNNFGMDVTDRSPRCRAAIASIETCSDPADISAAATALQHQPRTPPSPSDPLPLRLSKCFGTFTSLYFATPAQICQPVCLNATVEASSVIMRNCAQPIVQDGFNSQGVHKGWSNYSAAAAACTPYDDPNAASVLSPANVGASAGNTTSQQRYGIELVYTSWTAWSALEYANSNASSAEVPDSVGQGYLQTSAGAPLRKVKRQAVNTPADLPFPGANDIVTVANGDSSAPTDLPTPSDSTDTAGSSLDGSATSTTSSSTLTGSTSTATTTATSSSVDTSGPFFTIANDDSVDTATPTSTSTSATATPTDAADSPDVTAKKRGLLCTPWNQAYWSAASCLGSQPQLYLWTITDTRQYLHEMKCLCGDNFLNNNTATSTA